MNDALVRRKAEAASLWCHFATQVHGDKANDKPWLYLIVPEPAVLPSSTLEGLMATHRVDPSIDLLSRFELVG
jgi:type III restriction enzyme